MYLIAAAAGIALIAIVTFAMKQALTSAYNSGVSDTQAVALEAANLVKDEALREQRKVHNAELAELQRIARARLKTSNELTKLNSRLILERKHAEEQLALTMGSIPDEDWFYLHEPIGPAVADGMRND